MERDFRADAPNMLWVTDVTRFTMDGYKCWLSRVVDRFDGMVVSWTLSRSPDAGMADRMLLDAVVTLRDGERSVVHSDRGCHYRWPGWIRICEEHGLMFDKRQGMQPGQRGGRGVLRQAQERVLLRAGLEWRGLRGVPQTPGRLPDPLQ